MKNQSNVEPGSTKAPDKFYLRIKANGPILVGGQPPLKQQFILVNEDDNPWEYKAGAEYSTQNSPTALCRCGHSQKKPYCDGSHQSADWDPELTASGAPLLDVAETFVGPTLKLSDATAYCAFARFCDAKGRVWNLVEMSDNPEARALAIREAEHCPAGRLIAWDKTTGEAFEPHFEPSLGLIEDPAIGCSGPLWVRGGIQIIRDEDDFRYEIRNRVTLCRCGNSSNKPYCDGSHASTKFEDGLPKHATGEVF